ncbi:MAG: hypothetical protein NWE86_02985 [Candidatus Bathyarchaeota archaeon]|nr:hypothetical protein [Candidatus Bathyarchaeota archaeon]
MIAMRKLMVGGMGFVRTASGVITRGCCVMILERTNMKRRTPPAAREKPPAL